MKLRSYLAVLVLAGLVPLIGLTAAMTITLARQQRAAVDRGLSNTVSALAAVVDNELETSIKSLETLATSQRLDTDDLPAFYEHASRVRALHGWRTIGLIDSAGQHRLNVARPLGASRVRPTMSCALGHSQTARERLQRGTISRPAVTCIGRTGRAGCEGEALTPVTPREPGAEAWSSAEHRRRGAATTWGT